MYFTLNKSIIIVTILAILIAILIVVMQFFNEKENNEVLNSNWEKVGHGNLQTEKILNKYYLYNPSNILYVYKVTKVTDDVLKTKKHITEEINTDITEDYSINLIRSDGQIFSKSESFRLSDGRLILEREFGQMKDENLWIVDPSGNVESLLNMKGFEELNQYVKERKKGQLIWAIPLGVLEDNSVVFYSNKNTAENDFFSYSIFIIDKDKNERIIFDAGKYNQDIRFIGAEQGNIVGYAVNSELLLIYNTSNGQLREIPFKGEFDSLSLDGRTILYRERNGAYIQNEFYLYDILTNESTYIGMPEGYFYNYIGAWSENGDKFAFLMSQEEVQTNAKIAIIDTNEGILNVYDKPTENSRIQPDGYISWINNNYLVINLDDNSSWSLKIEY